MQDPWRAFHHYHSGSVNVTGFLCGLVLWVDDLGSLTISEALNFDIDSDADVAGLLCGFLQHSKCRKESCTEAVVSKSSFI